MQKIIYDDDNQPMKIADEHGMVRIWYGDGDYWCWFLDSVESDKLYTAKKPSEVLAIIGK